MSVGFWQLLIIALIVILLFGRGKISDLMGDVAKGIKSFKKGMAEDDEADDKPAQAKTIEHKPAEPVAAEKAQDQSKAG